MSKINLLLPQGSYSALVERIKDFIVSGILASFITIALYPIANGYGNTKSKTPKRGKLVSLLCFPWSIAMVAVNNNPHLHEH